MKILKYIFFLIVLFFIGFSVFIATQKSDFTTTKSTFIKVPRKVVFAYMNDYRNWEQWASWKEDDASMKFSYPDKIIGQATYCAWIGNNSEGTIRTKNTIENKKIEIILDYNGNKFDSEFDLKDSLSGTKISWKSKGEINFFTKISSIFSGGAGKYFNTIFERSLNNLNTILTHKAKDLSVKVNGLVTIPARYFVKSSYVCAPAEMQSNINLGLSKIKFFFKNNNIKMNGKPYIIKEFASADTLRFSVYGPMKEQIFVPEGSDLTAGFAEGFTALKTTLTGDYSHMAIARTKAVNEFNLRKLRPSATILPMDVYFTTVEDNKRPSKWVTFIQIPIYSKPAFVAKKYKPRPKVVAKPVETPVVEPVKDEF